MLLRTNQNPAPNTPKITPKTIKRIDVVLPVWKEETQKIPPTNINAPHTKNKRKKKRTIN
jgi:hypothetical protein